MSIGYDPREWLFEVFVLTGFVSSAAIAYTQGDATLGIASVFILILTVYLWRLRVKLSISVRGASE
ncbi:hypothetical protein DJ68_05345 [Halorubrum sp. C3]|nr:hypothetical protein DJ68_05345 [Halorubrum sp. C3]